LAENGLPCEPLLLKLFRDMVAFFPEREYEKYIAIINLCVCVCAREKKTLTFNQYVAVRETFTAIYHSWKINVAYVPI
jgi:hypothetical protein